MWRGNDTKSFENKKFSNFLKKRNYDIMKKKRRIKDFTKKIFQKIFFLNLFFFMYKKRRNSKNFFLEKEFFYLKIHLKTPYYL